MSSAVTVKSFLPQREIDTCQRVREIRLTLKWGQPDFAEELGITRERLASYEYAKAPVRYELGKRLCYRFGVNQRWLADGTPPRKHYIDISPNVEYSIKPKELFTVAYDRVLKSWVEERLDQIKTYIGDTFESGEFEEAVLDNFPAAGAPLNEGLSFYLERLIQMHLHRMPPHLQAKYYEVVLQAADSFYKGNELEIKKWMTQSSKKRRGPAK